MAINQILENLLKLIKVKKVNNSLSFFKNLRLVLYLVTFSMFLLIFIFINDLINKKQVNESNNLSSVVKSEEFKNLGDYLVSKINSPYTEVEYLIQNNDSVEKILKKFNVNASDIKKISINLKEKKLTNIYKNRKLLIVLKQLEDKTNTVVNLVYPKSNTSNIEIRKSEDNFIIHENILQLYKKEVVVKNKIKNNLYTAAIEAGLEPNIILKFARIYGFEVDFQRDIRKNDWFEILYERFEDDNEIVKDTGKIIYASMYVNGKEINLYSFNDGQEDGHYDIKGRSIVKSLMKTPINGARLSSSFGMRKHPILGFNKMHRGTDFAAPSGTPIMASGSGTVTRARWCGGGGNCVKIKHNSTYQTIYAHMKSFARGIKEGKKVKQGQIIGYVGSTGMSTGPHLHYEVIVNGKKVNSQRLKLPSGKILKGAIRENFELERIKVDLKLSNLR
tara:strand:+ start:225 stop:1565 length:1341 start_codon:yes stop_codon:yes gene_type:complete